MTTSLATLKNLATQLRIDSVRSTSEAGSGHPTSCLSAAEIVSTLFFAEMHFDPKNPQNPDNDRFVLSKGHAAPILYAAWAEAGLFPREDLLKLRRIDSDRKASDATPVLCRRGDRLARAGICPRSARR
jgi:transketolase